MKHQTAYEAEAEAGAAADLCTDSGCLSNLDLLDRHSLFIIHLILIYLIIYLVSI